MGAHAIHTLDHVTQRIAGLCLGPLRALGSDSGVRHGSRGSFWAVQFAAMDGEGICTAGDSWRSDVAASSEAWTAEL